MTSLPRLLRLDRVYVGSRVAAFGCLRQIPTDQEVSRRQEVRIVFTCFWTCSITQPTPPAVRVRTRHACHVRPRPRTRTGGSRAVVTG